MKKVMLNCAVWRSGGRAVLMGGGRRAMCAFALALVLVPACAPTRQTATPSAGAAQPGSIPRALATKQPSVAVTKHSGEFGGQKVDYTATVEEHILNGPDGVPNAALVTIAYVRDGVRDRANRPVAFVFNGGPGASSSPLHFNGIGPRVGGQAGSNTANPHSLLDVTDLVFIDPVGTGFSRPFTREAGVKYYWHQAGDAASVRAAIGRWLKKNDRERSPRYLIGESFGTSRIGTILANHPEMKWDGVVLVSGVASGAGVPNMNYLRGLPSMAVSAWHFEKIPRKGRTVDQIWDEAVKFTRAVYAPALAKGDALSAAEKKALAQQLAGFTGLPVAFIEEKNLRLTPSDFLMNLLKDQNLRISNQDTRRTGPLVLSAEEAARQSPAEGLGGTAIGTAMQGPALMPGSDTALVNGDTTKRSISALERYLRKDLGFQTPETYRSLNLDINPLFRTGGNTLRMDPAPQVAERMKTDPNMRLFWIQGYYDLNTPAYSVVHAYEAAGIPKDRTTGMMALGPHTVFGPEESKKPLSAALRAWIK
jgi:carboxypeptidase C (cathepsin A)